MSEHVTAAELPGNVDEAAAGLTDLPDLDRATPLFAEVALAEDFVDFLTGPSYRLVD